MVYNTKLINFNNYIDLKDCVESMLFNSGEVVAEATFEYGNKQHITISLEVRGDVRLEYKGTIYKHADEFPAELKQLIATEFWWDANEDVNVSDNNWFEYMIRTDRWTDGVMCEGNLVQYSIGDLKNEMQTIAEYFTSI